MRVEAAKLVQHTGSEAGRRQLAQNASQLQQLLSKVQEHPALKDPDCALAQYVHWR